MKWASDDTLMPAPVVEVEGVQPGADEVLATLQRLKPVAAHWRESDELKAWIHDRTASAEVQSVRYGTPPTRGWIGECPVYCAMWCQPASPEIEPVGRAVQVMLLAAMIDLMNGETGLTPYLPAVRSAGLAVRHVLQGTVPHGRLSSLLTVESISDARDALARAIESQLTEPEQARMRGLLTLVLYAIDMRTPRARSSRTHVASEQQIEGDGWFKGYTAISDDVPAVLDEEGGAPVRESPSCTIMFLHPPSPYFEARKPTLRQAHWRAKQQTRAIRTRAQGLMVGPDKLQLVDIGALHTTIAAFLRNRSRDRFPVALVPGLVALTTAVLTGVRIKDLSRIKITKSPAVAADKTRIPQPRLSRRELTLPVLPLTHAFIPAQVDRDKYRELTPNLILPLQDLVLTELVQTYFDELGDYFARDDIETLADSTCRWINERHGARLSSARVADFLTRQVLATTDDWADAAFFAHGRSGDASARLYYYAPRHQYVVGLYQNLWRDVCRGLDQPDFAPTSSDTDACVGSAACPAQEHVTQMVAAQVAICRAACAGRPGPLRLRARHNAIALYTWLMLHWISGARAVDESIVLSNYDEDTGLLALSDKDTDEYYSARVAWLPTVARKQIKVYRASVKAMSEALKRTLPHTLFFINHDGETEPLTIARCRARLVHYPYRLNAQRHYIRTNLRELGVPAQAVDALLGHGALGQEPYVTQSAYCVRQMVVALEGPVQELVERCGWAVVPTK